MDVACNDAFVLSFAAVPSQMCITFLPFLQLGGLILCLSVAPRARAVAAQGAMTDDSSRQISQMIQFILQEAHEKAEEIRQKTNAEYEIQFQDMKRQVE